MSGMLGSMSEFLSWALQTVELRKLQTDNDALLRGAGFAALLTERGVPSTDDEQLVVAKDLGCVLSPSPAGQEEAEPVTTFTLYQVGVQRRSYWDRPSWSMRTVCLGLGRRTPFGDLLRPNQYQTFHEALTALEAARTTHPLETRLWALASNLLYIDVNSLQPALVEPSGQVSGR